MTALELASIALLGIGLAFFVAGTIALLRFPDLFSRLHALTKADNVGLGFVVLALALQAESLAEVIKLGAIWFLVVAASACVGHLIGNEARQHGLPISKGDS